MQYPLDVRERKKIVTARSMSHCPSSKKEKQHQFTSSMPNVLLPPNNGRI